jgi:peptidoglycan/xylan/chitin deacetylase (PgdA/CDA1 family)
MARRTEPEATCFRHPTREARRRCFHCKNPLCPQCQVHTDGHIFCSERCARLQRRSERIQRLARLNATALKGAWFRALFFTGLLAAGGVAIWFAAHADRFLSGPDLLLPAVRHPKERGLDAERIDWDAPGTIYIESPAQGSSLKESLIRVEGRAPAEAMVGLYVNGQKVEAQMAAGGRWSFEGVPLTERRNIIQARFFDNRGNSSYSPALSVELAARPAPPLQASAAPEALLLPPQGADNLIRGPLGRREIFLTFDGGSNANATEAILDTLSKEGIHATMFLTGEFLQRYPDLVRRIAEGGHVVGNHTFSHPHLTTYSFNGRQATLAGVTREFLQGQLQRAAGLYRIVTGKGMAPLWRAPFGEFNREILGWAQQAGYRHVYWTPHMDTLDWVPSAGDPLFRSPQQILQNLMRVTATQPGGADGGIVLMHLGTERENSLRADTILPELIGRWRAQGYNFSTVDQVEPGN